MPLRVETHTFQTPNSKFMPDGEGLWMTAKRYTTPTSMNDCRGLTLLFTHCVGAQKEEWELVIEELFRLQASKDEQFRVREVWSFDRQNHGDAAVLNEHALRSRPDGVSLYEWALALASFVRSPFMDGHRMVPVGHSAGSTAWQVFAMLTTKEFPGIVVPYASMIIVESTIVKQEVFERELDERMSYMDFVVTSTRTRRDQWPSREDALKYFSKRFPWSMWDPRSIKLLVDNALQDSPNGKGVVLKCPKEQEAVSYPDKQPHFECATQLGKICHSVPVHLIWGERIEFIPEYIRESLSDASDGRSVASVTYVEDAGHMVVQEKPELLAQTMAVALDAIPAAHLPRICKL